ncbi:SDR family oxidoreductase [bacterium]|nr:SDR family oxidoreductase [bacterium]
MNENKVLILGATGFLGSYFNNFLQNKSIAHSSNLRFKNILKNQKILFQEFHDESSINQIFKVKNIDKIINCIAISDIEKCEANSDLAKWVNSDIPRLLAKKAYSSGIQLIHLSTDAVFSDNYTFPTELNVPQPKSIYGKTKLNGEINVTESNKKALICRVNFFGWNDRGKSLFNYFYSNISEGNSVIGFTDIFFTPIYAADTVKIIVNLSKLNLSGIYHVVGNDRISKYQFALMVGKKMGSDTSKIEPSLAKGNTFSLFRSRDLSLSNAKLRALGVNIPSISQGLDDLFKELESVNDGISHKFT